MKQLLSNIINFIMRDNNTTIRDAYLSQATDRVDLEYSMRTWDQQNPNLRDWQ